MAKVHEQVEAEFENIERVVAELPGSNLLANLSSLELAGVAALIHNFYNGIENILKHIVISCGKEVPGFPLCGGPSQLIVASGPGEHSDIK